MVLRMGNSRPSHSNRGRWRSNRRFESDAFHPALDFWISGDSILHFLRLNILQKLLCRDFVAETPFP